MNWAAKIERIAGDHADSVRRIRYRIEEVDDEARQTNATFGVVNSGAKGAGSRSKNIQSGADSRSDSR